MQKTVRSALHSSPIQFAVHIAVHIAVYTKPLASPPVQFAVGLAGGAGADELQGALTVSSRRRRQGQRQGALAVERN